MATLRAPGRAGFTLLELILVITILGFLAAMILPSVGRMTKAERIKLTQDRLEQVRSAIVGPRFVFDSAGRPVVGGYVGDVGELPELRPGSLHGQDGGSYGPGGNTLTRTEAGHDRLLWAWDHDSTDSFVVDARPLNQTAALWEAPASPPNGWRGPYLGPGRDPYRHDHTPYAEDWDILGEPGRYQFLMRCASNRLHDAWGRGLLFWRDGDDLVIISEGPNGRSEWNAGDYQGDDGDDIVLRVSHDEWNPLHRRPDAIAQALLDAAPMIPHEERTPYTALSAQKVWVFTDWATARDTCTNVRAMGLDPWGRAFQIHQSEDLEAEPMESLRPIWLVCRGRAGTIGRIEYDDHEYVVPAVVADLSTTNERRVALAEIITAHRTALGEPAADLSSVTDEDIDALAEESHHAITVAIAVDGNLP